MLVSDQASCEAIQQEKAMRCTFIVVHWYEESMFIVACRQKATDQEIFVAVAESFVDIIGGDAYKEFFNEKRRRMSDRNIARAIVQHAIKEKREFWKVVRHNDTHFSINKELGEWDIERYWQKEIKHTFDELLEETRKAFGWYRFTQD